MAIDWDRIQAAIERAIKRGDLKPGKFTVRPRPPSPENKRLTKQAMLDVDKVNQVVAEVRAQPDIKALEHHNAVFQIVMTIMLSKEWMTPMLLEMITADPMPYLRPTFDELKDMVLTEEEVREAGERWARVVSAYMDIHRDYYTYTATAH